MAFRFRLCQNDTTAVLRDLFNATPVRTPEASVQPLLVIAEKAGKTDKRGMLQHLLIGDGNFSIQANDDPVSNVNLDKTRSMDWDFGLKLLDGIFQGFKLPSASIGAQLNGAKEISLSFNNVRRRWIDKNLLGSALKGLRVDLQHPSVGIFKGDDPWQMLLVTDVIASNGFAINVEKTRDDGFNVEAPAIQQILNEAKVDVKAKSNSKNSIAFEGNDYLTFAFTCVKLEVDPQTGALGVGATVVTKEGKTVKKSETPEPVELDDDLFEPGMLEWD
jgi:hypothetical protein